MTGSVVGSRLRRALNKYRPEMRMKIRMMKGMKDHPRRRMTESASALSGFLLFRCLQNYRRELGRANTPAAQ